MPRASKVCSLPECPDFADPGETRCNRHKINTWQTSTWTRPPGWARIRQSVLHRDRHTCVYCGNPADQVDHVLPVSQGGSNKRDNLVASCKRCNLSKNQAAVRGNDWKPPRASGGST
jgi:5-methylcytosine-specific restriction endonuclease McrA